MSEYFKSGKFEYKVRFSGNERATIHFITEPKSEKIEIKYATREEPKKLLGFDKFNEIISKHSYSKRERAGFYVINEEVNQRELVWIPIKWEDAPSYSDTVGEKIYFRDLSDFIKKIGG